MSNPTNVVPFEFEGNDVRVIEIDGDPWFVGRDVASVLGYSDVNQAIRKHCKGGVETTTPTSGGSQKVKVIPERDVYRLIMRSKLPSAERFEEWVVGEVLPSIRKHGGYITGQNEMSNDELLARAVLHAQSVIEEKNALIAKQNEKIEEDTPKVEYYEAVGNSRGFKSIGETIKNFGIVLPNGNILGRNKALSILRAMKILQSSQTYWNHPYQQYINQGYFVTKQTIIPTGDTVSVTLVTPKGHQWLYKKLN